MVWKLREITESIIKQKIINSDNRAISMVTTTASLYVDHHQVFSLSRLILQRLLQPTSVSHTLRSIFLTPQLSFI